MDFLEITILIIGLLQLILFFKVWGMTNDIHELKEHFVKNKNKKVAADNINVDEWIKDEPAK